MENPDRPNHCGPVHFIINREPKESLDHTLTGHQLKVLAGVPDSDELFLETNCGDEVVANDVTTLVRNGDRFHTMPSPQYGHGLPSLTAEHVEEVLKAYPGELAALPTRGANLILHRLALPRGYSSAHADVLIQIPPLYPDASPDMFWISPLLTLASGGPPHATSVETVAGREWQRFSWHLQPHTWHPGTSRLRDFVRAVVARLNRVG